MKSLNAFISGAVALVFSLPLLAADTLTPEPQQWQPIQEVAIQGDIPELRGMPEHAQFRMHCRQSIKGILILWRRPPGGPTS